MLDTTKYIIFVSLKVKKKNYAYIKQMNQIF